MTHQKFPYSNHPLASATHCQIYEAVMALADSQFEPDVTESLQLILSCVWDYQTGMFVNLNPNNAVLAQAVETANRQLISDCEEADRKILELSDRQKMDGVKRLILNGLIPKYKKFFDEIGVDPNQIFPYYNLSVSRYPAEETTEKFGSFGMIYNTSTRRRIFVSSQLEGFEFLTLSTLPGLITGLYGDIGASLHRFVINMLIDEPDMDEYKLTHVIRDCVIKSGFDLKQTLLDSLKGKPEALFQAIINQYGLEGLGVILLLGSSSFPDSMSTDLPRFGFHEECAYELLEELKK